MCATGVVSSSCRSRACRCYDALLTMRQLMISGSFDILMQIALDQIGTAAIGVLDRDAVPQSGIADCAFGTG